jgi:hypothetical protein
LTGGGLCFYPVNQPFYSPPPIFDETLHFGVGKMFPGIW